MQSRFVNVVPSKTTGKITILPVEVHYSRRTTSNGFLYKEFKKLIKRVETEPDTYIIFPGDLLDAHRPSMRERMNHAHADSDRKSAQEEADNWHREHLDSSIIADLRPIKHKILAAVDGDHYVIYQNGMTSTQYILNSLGIGDAYLGRRMGWCALKLAKRSNKVSASCLFKIFIRHGKGSSTTIGTDMNALIKQSTGFIADLYIAGHTHKKWVHSAPFLDIDRGGKIIERTIGWARAGSLLRGFVEGQTTYSEDCEYQPLDIGYPDIYILTGLRNDNLVVKGIKGLI